MQKNQAFPSFCSRDIVDLKILQYDLCKNTANNKLLLKTKVRKKLITKFCNIIKNIIFEKSNSVTHNTTRALTPCWVPEKKQMSQFVEKFQTEGWTKIIHRKSGLVS